MNAAVSGFRFEHVFIDLKNRQLWRDGRVIPLNSKYFDVLALLISRHHQLVSREELFDRIWSDVIVTDWALSQCIKDIRKALGDNAKNPKYIKTLPKQGFMFVKEPKPVWNDVTVDPDKNHLDRRPFKFLDYYRESDADLFFGRDTEIKIICSKIIAHRSLILYGRSGTGKSSVTYAGVLPELRRAGHTVTVSGGFHSTLVQQFPALEELSQSDNPEYYVDKLASAPGKADNLRIIILDHFEEIFTLTSSTERTRVIEELGILLKQEKDRLRIVFVLREDYLAEMNHLKGILPEIFHHEFRLEQLHREQAEQAVIQPLLKLQHPVNPDLVHLILNGLEDGERVDPSQLQIVCDALFDAGGITRENYQNLGGVPLILERYMNRVLQRFKPDKLSLINIILGELISVEKQRRTLSLTEIFSRFSEQFLDRSQFQSLIEQLLEGRIIRQHRQDGDSWIELTHDLLIPEILRRQSREQAEIKQAQALIERGMQNFLNHQFLLEGEALDMILTVGSQLNLMPGEADMIVRSLIKKGQVIPEWIARKAPTVGDILTGGSDHPHPEVRAAAVASVNSVPHVNLEEIVRERALWDHDLMVRKTASITMLDKFREEAVTRIVHPDQQPRPGKIRQAVSLAFMRDYHRKSTPLSKMKVSVALLVLLGLVWVRVRRERARIWKQSLGATMGASFSGFLVGILLGILMVYLRQAPLYESATLMLVLPNLGTIAGFSAGLGISLFMSIVQAVSYRHSRYWAVLGATAGGALVGGILHLIGVDTFLALFGQRLSGIAGAYEGALIGLGLSLGYVSAGGSEKKFRYRILLGSLGAMLAALVLTLIEGNLFSASIEAIARSFSSTHIQLDLLANLFGEAHFGNASRLILAAIEGLLFGGFFCLGMHHQARKYAFNLSDSQLYDD